MQIIISEYFLRLIKPLAKKYSDLKDQSIACIKDFYQLPQKSYLGNGVYKIRFTSKFLNRGKSGSFRLILWVLNTESKFIPLCIYFKGDKANISIQEIYLHERNVETDITNGNYFVISI